MGSYLPYLLAQLGFFSVLAIATDVLGGHAGRLGVSSIALAGLGAYSYALLVSTGHVPPLLAVALVALLGLLSVPLQVVLLLPLKADAFLLATLAVQMAFTDLANNLTVTHGPRGIGGIRGLAPASLISPPASSLLLLIPTLLVALTVGQRTLSRRAFGRDLHAYRDNELSATSVGVARRSLFSLTFGVHTVLSCMAGVAFAMNQTYIAPASFGLWLSLRALSIVFLGGLAAPVVFHVVSASVFLTMTEAIAFLGRTHPALVGPAQQILFSGALIVILILRPRGLRGPVIATGPAVVREP